MLHIPGLYILQTDHKQRGVFTSEQLSIGDLIEICPILKIPENQLNAIHITCLHDYYFIWDEAGIGACIALGYGSLYNHHYKPNAEVIMDYTEDTIHIQAIRNIMPGQEILIDYTGGTKGVTELWFTPL